MRRLLQYGSIGALLFAAASLAALWRTGDSESLFLCIAALNVLITLTLAIGVARRAISSDEENRRPEKYSLALAVGAVAGSMVLLALIVWGQFAISVDEYASAPVTAPGSPGPSPSIPEFPWPPPTASASTVMPRRFFERARTLYDVNQALVDALVDNGYVDRSYFGVPNGFALVTRLEQIERDGASRLAERWSVERPTLREFSLGEYVRQLFTAPAGRYRVMVFVVTKTPFSQSEETPDRAEAMDWLRRGANVLPGFLAVMPYNSEFNTTALIYDFVKGAGDATLMNPSELDAQTHLLKAQLWPYLVRRPASALPLTAVKLEWRCSADLDLSVEASDDMIVIGQSDDVVSGPGAETVRTAGRGGALTVRASYVGGEGPCPYEISVTTNDIVRQWSGTVSVPGEERLLTDIAVTSPRP